MNSKMNCEAKTSLKLLTQKEMAAISGGVQAAYDANGRIITCTDPRRRQQTLGPFYPKLPRFGF
jgi:bacteriocin-like protein